MRLSVLRATFCVAAISACASDVETNRTAASSDVTKEELDQGMAAAQESLSLTGAGYCDSKAYNNNYFLMDHVAFANGQGSVEVSTADKMSFYEHGTKIALAGKTTVKIQTGGRLSSYGYPLILAAWLDGNRDKIFGATEKVFERQFTGSKESTISFELPELNGSEPTILRIQLAYSYYNWSSQSQCMSNFYGVTHDYSVGASEQGPMVCQSYFAPKDAKDPIQSTFHTSPETTASLDACRKYMEAEVFANGCGASPDSAYGVAVLISEEKKKEIGLHLTFQANQSIDWAKEGAYFQRCPEKFDRVIFVTRERYSPNFGGLSGADRRCQAVATKAGAHPKSVWKAVLSTSKVDAKARFGAVHDVYNRAGEKVNQGDFWSPVDRRAAAVGYDENGQAFNWPDGRPIWSGTTRGGIYIFRETPGSTNQWGDFTCGDWASTKGSTNPAGAGTITAAWAGDGNSAMPCTKPDGVVNLGHLFCMSDSPESFD